VTRDLPIRPRSAFDSTGFAATVDALVAQTQQLYLADSVPWVIGYSGGKDSTAVLQIVWLALAALPEEQRAKPVHVISTDTLVENPVVAAWVTHSLDVMKEAAERQGVPISPHRLTPAVTDTFWVNLIGRGYPAPRPKFRWCTERLKIKPSNAFIRDMVRSHGEAILVLGHAQGREFRSLPPHDRTGIKARPRPAEPQRVTAELSGVLTDRELVQRRRMDLPHAAG
jgi:DNA sulfur modification protein DndC